MLSASTEIQIRFADCDPMGHTNNANYFTYMEQARVALFAKAFGVPDKAPIREKNFPFILAEISCRFLKPTYANERLAVEARVTEVKNSSFLIAYDLLDSSTRQKVAEGESAQVWYDYQQKKAVRIPDDFRKVLEN